MAQQTAVEWLLEQFDLHYKLKDKFLSDDWNFLEEQAKQMEKKQIVDAHYQGYRNDIGTTEVSEQYYNETFTSTPQGENPSATRTEQF